MKKHVILILKGLLLGTLLVSFLELSAQDPQFTQFYANPLYLNPAFAGSKRCPRMHFNYRDQWPGITGTFVTTSASYDQYVDPLQGGIGFIVTNDRAGENTLNSTTASLIYSYKKNITRKVSFAIGFQTTYIQKKLDWSKLSFGDQVDKRYGFIFPTNEQRALDKVGYMDFSTGAMIFSDQVFIGYAAHHLTQPDEAFITTSQLPMKHTAHAGAMLPTTGDATISPNLLYQKQGDFQQINAGVYFIMDHISAGVWHRFRDSFIVTVGVQQHKVRLGYSYDVTMSRLANASAGSHEVSLSLEFPCKPSIKRFRPTTCPTF